MALALACIALGVTILAVTSVAALVLSLETRARLDGELEELRNR